MDPTTLMAFLFDAPPHTRTVELLGSWDNFAHPYPMNHDRRRGKGSWSGCFRFENIIFDGDSPQWTKPRSGGLKEGGTYWYYYRLDDDFETYDQTREHTSNCPLLPGQVMNIVEVPTEIVEPLSRCMSAGHWELEGTLSRLPANARLQTLDPSDKFALLEAPPISKVHDRCNSDLALSGGLLRGMPSLEPLFASLPKTRPGSTELGRSMEPAKPFSKPVGPFARDSSDWRPEPFSLVDAYASQPHDAHPNPPLSYPPRPLRPSHQGGVNNAGSDFDLVRPMSNGQRMPNIAHAAARSTDASVPPRDLEGTGAHPTAPTKGNHWQSVSHSLVTTELPSQLPPVYDTTSPYQLSLPKDVFSVYGSPATAQGISPESDDIWSPCFSALTANSNEGVLTPYRLSGGGLPQDASIAEDPRIHHQQALDQIIGRLESLDAMTSSPDAEPHWSPDDNRPVFAGYALPKPGANESMHSLAQGKQQVSTTAENSTSFSYHVPLPTFLEGKEGGRSLVDDIFSELGYLGGNIS